MILIENEPTASTLKVLEVDMPDAVIANVNFIASPTCLRTHRAGLLHVAIHLHSGCPVILTSFESEEDLKKDEAFTLVSNRPNVKFLRLPVSLDDYRKAYQSLMQK
ncbi:MAG: hypothetical protein EXS59_02175 [Candidatus Taylorbacteria bacterium]|nr:hypothetical protein [Candidatus Taylorbacteria bacterium]